MFPQSECRYELRIRYLPLNLNDLYEKDKVTFHYYYDQVKRIALYLEYSSGFSDSADIKNVLLLQVLNDYLNASNLNLDQDVCVQLCCLAIRYFFKDMPQIALDKKSNLEYLEREVCDILKQILN